MTSTALKALTATTGNRTDKWNTSPEFVGDVVKFFGTIDLRPLLQIVRVNQMFQHLIIILRKLMV